MGGRHEGIAFHAVVVCDAVLGQLHVKNGHAEMQPVEQEESRTEGSGSFGRPHEDKTRGGGRFGGRCITTASRGLVRSSLTRDCALRPEMNPSRITSSRKQLPCPIHSPFFWRMGGIGSHSTVLFIGRHSGSCGQLCVPLNLPEGDGGVLCLT
jgi:hypothetical protein